VAKKRTLDTGISGRTKGAITKGGKRLNGIKGPHAEKGNSEREEAIKKTKATGAQIGECLPKEVVRD